MRLHRERGPGRNYAKEKARPRTHARFGSPTTGLSGKHGENAPAWRVSACVSRQSPWSLSLLSTGEKVVVFPKRRRLAVYAKLLMSKSSYLGVKFLCSRRRAFRLPHPRHRIRPFRRPPFSPSGPPPASEYFLLPPFLPVRPILAPPSRPRLPPLSSLATLLSSLRPPPPPCPSLAGRSPCRPPAHHFRASARPSFHFSLFTFR